MRQIHRSMLNIRVSLGRHITTGDAKRIEEDIQRFKPHILVKEGVNVLETERKTQIILENNFLKRARRDRLFAQEVSARYRDHTLDLDPFIDFRMELERIITATNRLYVFFVEGYSQLELLGFRRFMRQEVGRAASLLRGVYQKRIDETIGLLERMIGDSVPKLITPRNNRIIEGFERIPEELNELHLQEPTEREIRVLATFGSLHAGIIEKLRDKGFRVEATRDFQSLLDFRLELMLRLAKDTKMVLSQNELIRVLFLDMYDDVIDQRQTEQVDHVANSRKAFEKIGGEQGFMEFLRTAPRGDSLETFKAVMRETLTV